MTLRSNRLFGRQAWQHCQHIFTRNLFVSRLHFRKTHYEVLGLREACSQEEIKNAFFEKSKELHPDKNDQNPENHALFVAINEAYSVLSKLPSREVYDFHLAEQRSRHLSSYSLDIETNAPRDRVIFHDELLWERRDKSKDRYYENKPYYGIKGVRKFSNVHIASGVVLFMVIGALVHLVIARISSGRTVERLDKMDLIASQNYMAARQDAISNGNEKQLHLIFNQFHQKE